MRRKIVQIDEEKCTGCGLCAEACHEGAIAMVNRRQRSCATITATGWATVCRPVQRTRSQLRNAKRNPTTIRPSCPPKLKKRVHSPAAVRHTIKNTGTRSGGPPGT